MSRTALIGKAKELFVATLLVGRGLHVYFPLVDNGFDLIATTPDGSDFLPIQIKYKANRTGFTLKKADGDKFENADAVLVFGSTDKADEDTFYFIPAREWRTMVEDRGRGDGKVSVYLTKNHEWAEKFKGAKGIDLAFGSLLRSGVAPKKSSKLVAAGRSSPPELGARRRA